MLKFSAPSRLRVPLPVDRLFSVVLLLCLAGVVLTLTACEAESDAAPAQKPHTVRFTLGSYNLHNYFDQFNDPYTRDETTRPQDDRSIEALAETIRLLDMDFMGIQEVENTGVMIGFNRRALPETPAEQPDPPAPADHLDGPASPDPLGAQPPVPWPDPIGYYPYVYVGNRVGGRGINNGFFSRIPVESIATHRWDTLRLPGESAAWPFARPPVQVTLRPAEDLTIHVFIVHFKSKHTRGKPGDEGYDLKSTKWRLAEAIGLRRKIAALRADDPDAHVVLLGDFNDVRPSRTLQVLLAEGEDNAQLIDLFADYPRKSRYTYIPKRFRSQIDYVLTTPGLARYVTRDGLTIHHPPTTTGSDHAPIVVEFEVPTNDEDIEWNK